MISSSTGQTIFIWIRDRSSLWSMLKLTPARDSVATYSFTGMVTSPNWMAPFHIERATSGPRSGLDATGFRAGTRPYHRQAIAPASGVASAGRSDRRLRTRDLLDNTCLEAVEAIPDGL